MFDRELTQEQRERGAMLGNRAWLHSNYDRIQKEYRDKWIAILDSNVKAYDEDVEVVKRAIKERNTEAVIMRVPSTAVPTPI
jgi:hypothetical protein